MLLLADRLAELRKTANLSQKQLAEITGVPLRTYQRYEIGERQPTADTLVKLADSYNVSLDYLVGRSDNPNRN